MPFQIYRIELASAGERQLTFCSLVSIAGRQGPLCRHVRSLKEPAGEAVTWQLSEKELVAALGYNSVEEHCLVIDLKPEDPKLVSLYRLLRVWGHSYSGWTPVGLRLLPLYVDEPVPNDPAEFKKAFPIPPARQPFVHEFLYLNGGFGSQPLASYEWQWGRNGNVNAVLLWPDAFTFLVNSMQNSSLDDT